MTKAGTTEVRSREVSSGNMEQEPGVRGDRGSLDQGSKSRSVSSDPGTRHQEKKMGETKMGTRSTGNNTGHQHQAWCLTLGILLGWSGAT